MLTIGKGKNFTNKIYRVGDLCLRQEMQNYML
jgi:hypothetical protein